MSCLALSLQPTNGPDILLQTREWFPPARALSALSDFRSTRLALSKSDPSADPSLVGDDPLYASAGQLIVGSSSRFRVIYRLVNSIYVLAVTTPDDDHNNLFECISIVNQAVSVVVTACRGVDVTPDKLSRKYAEVYMALDIVLRGVSAIRLASMLGFLHGDSIAKMVHSSIDSENKIRGADNWAAHEPNSADRDSGLEAFTKSGFELPMETLAAGDEFAASIAPAKEADESAIEDEAVSDGVKDPFAASEAVNKPVEEALVGGFKKDKDLGGDLALALVGLEVTTLPPAESVDSTRIAVEGFEGDYGGIEFGNEGASLRETFEGMNDEGAFGGGLDVSEYVGTKKVVRKEGLGGLELLQTGPDVAPPPVPTGTPTPLENLLVQKVEMKGPEMYIKEVISVEFRESLLARVGLMGTVYLKTVPPKDAAGNKETEFSFRIDGTTSVKRVVMQSSRVSSLSNGMFHVRTAAEDDPIEVLKYSLQPRMTPIPLRVRLVKRHSGTLLSVMIQYVANPELPEPLTGVTFILKLPVDPTLLQVSPKAVLNRPEREVRWHVNELPLKGMPGKLRVRMPVDVSEEDREEELEVVCHVRFSIQGPKSLSGVSIWPAAEGTTDFYVVNHTSESGVYMCN